MFVFVVSLEIFEGVDVLVVVEREEELRNNWDRPRPISSTNGVEGVVVVKLKEDVKRIVAFCDELGRISVILGGMVIFELGITEKFPLERISNERYCIVVPFIHFLTSVTEDELNDPSV